jgi:hypothetical protein
MDTELKPKRKAAPKKKAVGQVRRLSFRVSPGLYKHVQTIADATGETMTGVLRRALLSVKVPKQ